MNPRESYALKSRTGDWINLNKSEKREEGGERKKLKHTKHCF